MKFIKINFLFYIFCISLFVSQTAFAKDTWKAFGGYSISKKLFDYIREILPKGSTIIECGSGWTSGELSKFYTVYSIEHNKAWLNRYNTNYIYAPIVDGWYDIDAIKKGLPEKYDLILIDGPPGYIGRMKFYDNRTLFDTTVPILIDDVNRTQEYELLLKLADLLQRTPQIITSENKKFGILLPNKNSNTFQDIDKLALQIYDNGMVLFGNYKLKNITQSSIYIDLRKLISYPTLLATITKRIKQKVHSCSFDRVCGVPYAALPLATAFSIQNNIPMLMKRKIIKQYGTKQEVDGKYQEGETCLLIEDVLTTGSSILETIETLERHKLIIKDVVVIVARTEEGIQNVEKRGYKVHALYTMPELFSIWYSAGRISAEQCKLIE